MKKRKDRNYGKGRRGEGREFQANQLKLSKKLFFMFVFQYSYFMKKNIYLKFCTFHFFRQTP